MGASNKLSSILFAQSSLITLTVFSKIFCGWATIRETRLGPNDSKQSTTWVATQAFKLFWSSAFLVLSLLGLILLVIILMYLCGRFRGSKVAVVKER